MPFETTARTAPRTRRVLAATALLTLTATGLTGCSGSKDNASTASSSGSATQAAASATSTSASPSASPSLAAPAATAPVRKTDIGVSVTGNFGQKPALTVPAGAAPKDLVVEVLVPGDGKALAKGDSLIGNYLGQTWKPKDGQVNVFDSSWDRKSLAAFQIGTGAVITGWDEGLVGQKVGSRLLTSIPPAKAYGATPDPTNDLSGQDLLFVVDIVDTLPPNASAKGASVELPTGYPRVTSVAGQEPSVTDVSGVTPPTAPKSAVLIEGTGEVIDPSKQLAVQYVQADLATGKDQTRSTWGSGVEVVPAASVLSVASAFSGKKVGSRVIALTPGTNGNPNLILIVDVVGQY